MDTSQTKQMQVTRPLAAGGSWKKNSLKFLVLCLQSDFYCFIIVKISKKLFSLQAIYQTSLSSVYNIKK